MTNWRNLKEGALVRVTVEGKAHWNDHGGIDLIKEGANYRCAFIARFTDAAWELLDPPLRVGQAKFRHNGQGCQVLAIHDGLAWIKHWHGGYDTQAAHHLENIDEEPKS